MFQILINQMIKAQRLRKKKGNFNKKMIDYPKKK